MDYPKVDYAKNCNCALPAINGNYDCCKNCPNNGQLSDNINTYTTTTTYMYDNSLRTCKACGKIMLLDEYNFCPYCGNKLN